MRKVIKLFIFGVLIGTFVGLWLSIAFSGIATKGGILWQYGYKRLYLGNHADIQSSLGLAWWLDGYVKCSF